MPTTDPGEKRMFASEVRRHHAHVLKRAEHIAEYAAHLLRELHDGRTATADTYAATIDTDIAELRRRLTALDALKQVEFVFDEPDAGREVER